MNADVILGFKRLVFKRNALKIAEQGLLQSCDIVGYYDAENLTVWLTEEDIAEAQLKDTTFHELCHHIIRDSPLAGTIDEKLEEALCMLFGNAFVEVVRRNPAYVSWLQSNDEGRETVDEIARFTSP